MPVIIEMCMQRFQDVRTALKSKKVHKKWNWMDRLWEEIRCSKNEKSFTFMCVGLDAYVCIMNAQVPMEFRERVGSPWNWSYRRLWTTQDRCLELVRSVRSHERMCKEWIKSWVLYCPNRLSHIKDPAPSTHGKLAKPLVQAVMFTNEWSVCAKTSNCSLLLQGVYSQRWLPHKDPSTQTS